jgi:hypothetical protein
MLQVQSQFSFLTEKKQDFFQTLALQAFQAHDSLNISYKSFMGLISTETVDSIISSDGNFWVEVWAEVAARIPSLQKLEVRHDEVNKRSFSHGMGSLEAAEYMDQGLQELGTGLRAGIWRVRAEPDGLATSHQLQMSPVAAVLNECA